MSVKKILSKLDRRAIVIGLVLLVGIAVVVGGMFGGAGEQSSQEESIAGVVFEVRGDTVEVVYTAEKNSTGVVVTVERPNGNVSETTLERVGSRWEKEGLVMDTEVSVYAIPKDGGQRQLINRTVIEAGR